MYVCFGCLACHDLVFAGFLSDPFLPFEGECLPGGQSQQSRPVRRSTAAGQLAAASRAQQAQSPQEHCGRPAGSRAAETAEQRERKGRTTFPPFHLQDSAGHLRVTCGTHCRTLQALTVVSAIAIAIAHCHFAASVNIAHLPLYTCGAILICVWPDAPVQQEEISRGGSETWTAGATGNHCAQHEFEKKKEHQHSEE